MIDDIKKKEDQAESEVESLSHMNKHLIREVSDIKRRHETHVAGINAIFESALNYIQKSHPVSLANTVWSRIPIPGIIWDRQNNILPREKR